MPHVAVTPTWPKMPSSLGGWSATTNATNASPARPGWLASSDTEHLHLPGGHVGAVVSKKAKSTLWPKLSDWWAARDALTPAVAFCSPGIVAPQSG
jgi:hypothetical protein